MPDNPHNDDLGKRTDGLRRTPRSDNLYQRRNDFYRFYGTKPNKSDRGNDDGQKEHKLPLGPEVWKAIWNWGVQVEKEQKEMLAKREEMLAEREEMLTKREEVLQKERHFESLKGQAQLAIDYINDRSEAFQELGYNIKQFNKMCEEAIELKKDISREPDNIEYKNLLADNCRAIIVMADDLNEYLSIDHHLEAKKRCRKKRTN